MKSTKLWSYVAGALVLVAIAIFAFYPRKSEQTNRPSLKVGIAPYQDMAMLMVYEQLGLEDKYNLDLDVATVAWEDIQASLASAGDTFDISFGSLIEFLTKWQNLSKGSADPIVFLHPAYVFKGGGFVTFSDDVPDLDKFARSGSTLADVPPAEAQRFLKLRIGAQTNSMWDMLIYELASQQGVPLGEVKIIDVPASDALLAAEAGSLDVAGAGVTQRNEALERGGRVVFSMDKFGFADITGFMCKQSVLKAKKSEIERFIHLWFDCVDYVYEDIDTHSQAPIAYLDGTSSTNYTVESYKRALEVEILPRTLADARELTIGPDAQYSIQRLQDSISRFLIRRGVVTETPPVIQPLELR